MSVSLQLDIFSHDVMIKQGKILFVNDSDEICQRIKIALWHYFGEYCLAPSNGVPWYSQILGHRISESSLINLMKDEILKVPGVLRVTSIVMNRRGRQYVLDISVVISSLSGTKEMNIQGLTLRENNG